MPPMRQSNEAQWLRCSVAYARNINMPATVALFPVLLLVALPPSPVVAPTNVAKLRARRCSFERWSVPQHGPLPTEELKVHSPRRRLHAWPAGPDLTFRLKLHLGPRVGARVLGILKPRARRRGQGRFPAGQPLPGGGPLIVQAGAAASAVVGGAQRWTAGLRGQGG